MDSFIEKQGKTIDDAVDIALEELGISEEDAIIEVLEEGSKGILGLIGAKPAKVRVYKRANYANTIIGFLTPIFEKMQIDANIDISEEENSINVDLSGENIGIVIGHRGETLDSLQYLLSLVVNRGKYDYKRIILDVENYRQKRKETLERLAKRLAERVYKTRKSVTLEPMNPYERRIIHSTLQVSRNVTTFSIGDDPNRKVVIKLK